MSYRTLMNSRSVRMAAKEKPPRQEKPTRENKMIQSLSVDCRASKDGDCNWKDCPQERDNEPATSGRHCPLDRPQCAVCGSFLPNLREEFVKCPKCGTEWLV